MRRHTPELECSIEDKAILLTLVKSRTEEARSVERARIILACLEGKELQQVARELGVSIPTVSKWRKSFALWGLRGLRDRLRSGKPVTYDAAFRNRVLALLEQPPPPGMSHWDGLAAGGLSMDEKPSMQAIERPSGYVQTDSGKVVRALKSTYKRHGTLNLFAALEVGTGQVHTKFTDYKKREDFRSFLDDVLADQPPDREIHVILDNYSPHKRNDDWLAKFEGRVRFHFTPTSASWLNQIEIVFSLLQRKTLNGGSFKTKDQLREAIEAFIQRHNERAKPFRWRKREVKGSQLHNTIVNLRN